MYENLYAENTVAVSLFAFFEGGKQRCFWKVDTKLYF